jgi:hypothetical protein
MKIDFDQKPFASIPPRIRAWFQDVVDRAEVDPTVPIDRIPLPPGSTMQDALAVSECVLALFPRLREQRFTPVAVEFVL